MALIAQRTDASASVSFMDLSVEAEAFGATIRVSDDEVPTVTGMLVHDEDEAAAPFGPPGGGRAHRAVCGIDPQSLRPDYRPAGTGGYDRPVLFGGPAAGRERNHDG